MQPIQKLQQQAEVARHHHTTIKSEGATITENKSTFSATLIQYNADLGQWLCRLDNGSTLYAKSISAPGSKGRGDVVSLYKPQQGMPVIRYL